LNLLFISNYSLTPLYIEVGKYLKEKGYKIYWIVCSNEWELILKKEFDESCITRLKRNIINNKYQNFDVYIPLNEVLYIDREIKCWQSSESSKYLINLHDIIKNVLISNSIDCVFSENTWAHEIICAMLCQIDPEISAKHFSAHPVRIPDGRFAFFKDFLLYKLTSVSNVKSPLDLSDFFPENKEITIQDNVIVKRNTSLLYWYSKLVNFLTRPLMDIQDPTWNGAGRINSLSRAGSHLFRSLTYRFVYKLDVSKLDEMSKKYKLYVYAFHKEPETAINNKGRYYENQYQCILNIWRKLPQGSILLLKEHRVSIGDRGYFYFKKLVRLGNVFVLPENIPFEMLLKYCDACITISGTMAYEFALHNKVGITFAKTYFNKLKYSINLTNDDLTKGTNLDAIIREKVSRNMAMSNLEYCKYLSSRSYEGCIGDVNNLPEVMNASNIEKVCTGFQDLISGSI